MVLSTKASSCFFSDDTKAMKEIRSQRAEIRFDMEESLFKAQKIGLCLRVAENSELHLQETAGQPLRRSDP